VNLLGQIGQENTCPDIDQAEVEVEISCEGPGLVNVSGLAPNGGKKGSVGESDRLEKSDDGIRSGDEGCKSLTPLVVRPINEFAPGTIQRKSGISTEAANGLVSDSELWSLRRESSPS
jgi:hypothetical protein